MEGLQAVPAERQLDELRSVLEHIRRQEVQLVVPQVQLLRQDVTTLKIFWSFTNTSIYNRYYWYTLCRVCVIQV